MIFLATGKHFRETLDYAETLSRRFGLADVRPIAPDPLDLADEDAGGRLWRTNPDLCCHIRKVLPLQRALVGFDAWVNGRKRFQGDARAGIETIEAEGGRIKLNPLAGRSAADIGAAYQSRKRLLPLLPVTPDVDRPSTFQARFLDRAGRCAGAFGLGEVGFECCQAGWRAGIRPRLRRIGGRAVAGARPAGISRVVRRCRGSRRVGGACRCRAGCRRPLRCGGGGSSGTRTRRDSGVDGRGAGHGRFRAPSA